mmetsp:Transcript_43215/g.92215  ORF Transcript_43215/g.92215 Transcript_43215/m.92215 type:complete len:451 (+) Transcript_43215:165-1517(+)
MSDGPNLWYIGVGLEIVSTMSGTIGKQLIRLSELTKGKSAHLAKMIMIAGLVINTAVGPIVDMGAYSFASQSLIAPFGGLDVVWNALLAPFLLDEKLTWRRIVGCVLIMIGTGMAGCFGNHEDAEYTLEYLEETLLHVRVLIYFLVFFAWFLLNRFCLMNFPVGNAIRGVSLGCTAGTIAGNMFCVKAAIELIQRSINMQEGEIWLHWLPYVMLVGAVFFALTNVIYMTKGLQEFEALFMVTIYEGSMIVSGCVSGAIVLKDLRALEAWRIGLYSIGILTIVLGMYVIFSQEVLSRSSLAAGSASIEIKEVKREVAKSPKSPRKLSNLSIDSAVTVESVRQSVLRRSIHASVVPSPSPNNKMLRTLSDISTISDLSGRGNHAAANPTGSGPSETSLAELDGIVVSFDEPSDGSGKPARGSGNGLAPKAKSLGAATLPGASVRCCLPGCWV